MAKIITMGFKLLSFVDLTDTSKGDVAIEQCTGISHDASREVEERRYEDSQVPNITIYKQLGGSVTIKGDLEHYVTPGYDTQVRTDPLFEPNHYYLMRFLALNYGDATVGKMIYGRYIVQLKEFPKQSKSPGEVTDKEIVLAVALYTGGASVSYDFEKFYSATADGDPGPVDPTPTDDYNPLFEAEVDDTTKTIAAAEAEISSSMENPC